MTTVVRSDREESRYQRGPNVRKRKGGQNMGLPQGRVVDDCHSKAAFRKLLENIIHVAATAIVRTLELLASKAR